VVPHCLNFPEFVPFGRRVRGRCISFVESWKRPIACSLALMVLLGEL